MRLEVVIRYIGLVILFNSVFLFISFLMAVALGESTDVPLLYSTLIALVFGIFPLIYVQKTDYLTILEGISIVVFGWLITCLIGSLPYIMWGGNFTFVNSFFESVSGYTTTGSTIISDVESLPTSLLFWRASTHWIGGIGVILFTILILPESSTTRLALLDTEMSKLSKTNFQYRVKEILRILLYVYVGITVFETILLMMAGMNFFDALTHSFSTVATGGFSTKNTSIAYYHSVTIEVIIMVFMVLSGVHFGLTFATITGRSPNLFNSKVVRAYFIFLVGGILLVSLKLYSSDMYSWWTSVRYASFQVISLGTTTGFATVDTGIWPYFSQVVLIYFMIQCAMVGSTSGGLKFDRIYVFLKTLIKQIKLLQHPRAIVPIKFDKKEITPDLENHTLVFIIMYLLLILITTLSLTFLNVDNFTAFSSAVTTIGNVGPGFGQVSSMSNFSGLPDTGKFILSINMLLGRLEIFSILSLFFVKSWK